MAPKKPHMNRVQLIRNRVHLGNNISPTTWHATKAILSLTVHHGIIKSNHKLYSSMSYGDIIVF